MTPPADVRAELTRLRAYIDRKLNDEHAARQDVLEQVLEDLTDILSDLPKEG